MSYCFKFKTLTLWQPWASLIADKRKPEETRPRSWNYNGYVAIHAGQLVDPVEAVVFGYDPEKIVRGAVVAIVRKTGCVKFPSPQAVPNPYGNFAANRFGYLFDKVWTLPEPVPAKGKQGIWLWELPASLNSWWLGQLTPNIAAVSK